MTSRLYAICSLVLAVALIATLVLTNSHSTEAQPSSASMRVAVVDFTRLGQEVQDVKRIQDLIGSINELARVKAEYWEREIQKVQKNIEQLEQYGREGSDAWEEEMEKLRQYWAQGDSVKAVTEFQSKKLAGHFSSRLLAKMLGEIEAYSANNYDVVLKVLGTPGKEEMEELGNMGDAMQFNMNRAREVLYFNGRKVDDITMYVARKINNNEDADVTLELKKQAADIQVEIQEWRNKIK